MTAKGRGIFVCAGPWICEKKCLIQEASTQVERDKVCLSYWQALKDQ